jgi:hypothetical protein
MSARIAIALLAGVLGLLLWLAAAVALADHVIGLHWVVQAAYFVLAGIAWAFPARALILWAAGGRRRATGT